MNRYKIHMAVAGTQLLLAVPAVLLWRSSVLFVIGLSLFANFYAAVSATEAADDSTVMAELAEIRALLERDGQG